MQTYEYKAVPAPNRAKRYKGIKGNAARFAQVLSEVMNEMAVEGWEYQRSDSLPVEESAGLLKGRVENYHTVLIFRRAVSAAAQDMSGSGENHRKDAVPDVAPETVVAPAPVVAPAAVTALSGTAEPFVPAPAIDRDDGYPQDPPVTATPSFPDDDGPFGDRDTEDDPKR